MYTGFVRYTSGEAEALFVLLVDENSSFFGLVKAAQERYVKRDVAPIAVLALDYDVAFTISSVRDSYGLLKTSPYARILAELKR